MRILFLLGLAGVTLLAGGCGRAEENARQWAATASNTLGTFETQTARGLKDTMAAFDRAMEDLSLQKGATDHTGTEAVLTYRTATGTVVTIKLKEFPAYTNIKVRCGLVGDETLSREILAKVHRRL